MPGVRDFSTIRARSYISRVPLFTRSMVMVIVFFWVASLPSVWDVKAWGALVPDEVSLTNAYRLSTFPLVHLNLIHATLNAVALMPLMERFEGEYGTLATCSLFFGPLTSLPALLYLGIERGILRANNAIMGASMWVFLLLGMEAIRTYRCNPQLVIGTYHIPTWTTPLVMAITVAALIPNTSLLGHLCGLCIGYMCKTEALAPRPLQPRLAPPISRAASTDPCRPSAGLGHVRLLAPPERALRWIENRLNLLTILPHYISVDQKTYGRFGVLPTSNRTGGAAATELVGGSQRLGP